MGKVLSKGRARSASASPPGSPYAEEKAHDVDNARRIALQPHKHQELGAIRYNFRGVGFEAAKEASAASGKPLLLVFQEIPGCATCRNFGRDVLSHPLVVEAAESLFVTVAVNNATSGDADARVRDAFREPAWNNPVVRIVNARGRDLVPRVADGRWSVGAVASAMRDALGSRRAPTWLGLLADEATSRDNGVDEAVFAMYCFWSGEYVFAAKEGVVATQAGWYDGNEVVKVTFDPRRVRYADLIKHGAANSAADIVYFLDDAQMEVAQRCAAGRARRFHGPIRADSDPKHALRATPLRFVPMTSLQATLANGMVARNRYNEVATLLSPRQREILRSVGREGEHKWEEVVDVSIFDAWVEATVLYA
mmetsp:Transcript_43320/g.135666  ORF Transcript_43320/g.135666 Transcript_43320/m.135666 type:complete len:366 (-) Transcript_43320:248-1345(-)